MYNSPLNSLSTISEHFNTAEHRATTDEQVKKFTNWASDKLISGLVTVNNKLNPDLKFEVSTDSGVPTKKTGRQDDNIAVIETRESGSSGNGSGSGFGGSSPFNYSDWSPAAKLFGMDRSTAYAEHLANTAHQREVADLKAAGLNPVLGLGSGASIVSGSFSDGSGSGSTSSSSAEKTFFSDIGDVVGSLAGLAITLISGDKKVGTQAADMSAKAISKVGQLLDNHFASDE